MTPPYPPPGCPVSRGRSPCEDGPSAVVGVSATMRAPGEDVMKAVVYHGLRDVRIDQVPDPRIEAPGRRHRPDEGSPAPLSTGSSPDRRRHPGAALTRCTSRRLFTAVTVTGGSVYPRRVRAGRTAVGTWSSDDRRAACGPAVRLGVQGPHERTTARASGLLSGVSSAESLRPPLIVHGGAASAPAVLREISRRAWTRTHAATVTCAMPCRPLPHARAAAEGAAAGAPGKR